GTQRSGGPAVARSPARGRRVRKEPVTPRGGVAATGSRRTARIATTARPTAPRLPAVLQLASSQHRERDVPGGRATAREGVAATVSLRTARIATTGRGTGHRRIAALQYVNL